MNRLANRPVHRLTTSLAVLTAAACVGGVAVTATATATASSASPASRHDRTQDRTAARPDHYAVGAGGTLTVGGAGVLRNDRGDLTTVVRHTEPEHGTLDLQPDGSFGYTPAAGFTGTDRFTYTTSDAVHLYRTHLPPLATIGGVAITGGAYGSSFTKAPHGRHLYYGLTDRGPNADGPDGTKVEPLPDFTPAIAEFRLVHGDAVLLRRIPLTAADGQAYDGQVNCAADTGETITDLDGTTLPCSDTGYDPEGLVAARDGTFWVSDEYGPFITHFASDGHQLGRLAPFDHSLPRELANRVPNKGMEGLTITPDGRTLVGIMQSALQQPDLPSTVKAKNVTPLRIVAVDLRTGRSREYLYLLHDPKTNSGAVSEITALSNTSFLVDERDGNVEPGAYKRLFRIDLRGATDVGPSADGYDASARGRLVGGKSIEAYVGDAGTADAAAALRSAGIVPVRSVPFLDMAGLVTRLDPTGGFFGHDKIEGVALAHHGRTVVLANDNDFGIDGLADDSTAPPFRLHAKILPNGQQDDGEYLAVDLARLPARTTTATVTVRVRPAS